MAEQNKTRASLMQGMNLAGQKYFQVPYNVPSTFGNFYVGSPTETISDFVPLPLDFIQEDMSNMQNQFDAGILKADTAKSVLEGALQAAPYNKEFRDKLLQEYDLETKAQKWAKELAYNPLAAEKIARDVAATSNKFLADPRGEAVKREYNRYVNEIQAKPYQTGWSNFWNKDQFNQLDPTLNPADYTVDEHMKYVTDNYVKPLKDNITTRLLQGGVQNIREANGIIYYTDKGSTTEVAIDPKDENNPFVKEALAGLAQQLYNDPHPQAERIVRGTAGINTPKAMLDFITDLYANQFHRDVITKQGDDKIIAQPDGDGSDKTKEESPIPATVTEMENVSAVNVNPNYIKDGAYNAVVQDVDALTRSRTAEGSNTTTFVPVRRIADMQRVFPNVDFNNISDGQTITHKGKEVSLSAAITPDILQTVGLPENVGIGGTVTYKMQKQGDLLVPVVDEVSLIRGDGGIVSDKDVNAVKVALRDKTMRAKNLMRDAASIEKKVEEAAWEAYNKMDATSKYRVQIRQAIAQAAYEDNPEAYEGKNFSIEDVLKWQSQNPSKAKKIVAANIDDSIKDEVTKKFYEAKTTGMNVISFRQNAGGQRTNTEIDPLSKFETDLSASLGTYKMVKGEDGESTMTYVSESPQVFDAFFDKGSFRDADKKYNGKSTVGLSMTSKEAKKNGVRLSLMGIAMDENGTWNYVSEVDVMSDKADAKYKDLDGRKIKTPMTAVLGSHYNAFVDALGIGKDSAGNSGTAFTQILGGVMSANQNGTIDNIDDKNPWIPGAASIEFNKLELGAQDNQGDLTVVDVMMDDGKMYQFKATSPGDAAKELWKFRQQILGYQEFVNSKGTGGSSEGKSLGLFQKNKVSESTPDELEIHMRVYNAINKQNYSTHNNKLGTGSAALGKYDLVYSHHEKEIKSALDDLGIKYNPNDTRDIQTKFLDSPTAQDIVGSKRMVQWREGAEDIVEMYPDLNLDSDKMLYLTHYLGNSGAKTYMSNVVKYGVEEADRIFMEWSEKQNAKNIKPSVGLQKFIEKIK